MSNEDGLQNAAILMMSLGEAEASEVFKHLSPKEVQKLGEAIAKTSQITRERVDEVVDKFHGVAASHSLLVSNSGDYVRSVLKLALGDDKAALLIDRIFGSTFLKGGTYPKSSSVPNRNTMFFNSVQMFFGTVTLVCIQTVFFN